MQAKISISFKRPMGYYLYLLRKSIPFMIVYAVLFFMSSPYLLYFDASSRLNLELYYYSLVQAGNIFSLPVFTLATLLPAVLGFKFLTNRSETDRVYSLPLSKTSLFFTHFAAGFTSVLIPYAIFANPLPVMFSSYFAQAGEKDAMDRLMKNLFVLYGLRALMLLAIFAFAVFLCVNLGRIFDICLYCFLLSYMLPLACSAIISLLSGNLLGITNTSNFYARFFTFPSSVSYNLFNSFPGLVASFFMGSGTESVQIKTIIVVYSACAAIFTALSFWLFRIRKRERAGSPFCFEYIKIVLAVLASLFLGIISVLLIAKSNFTATKLMPTILPFIIASAAVYAGAMAIAKRSFKILGRDLLYYIGAPALYGVLIVYVATGAFGKITYVPKTADIESVTVSLNENVAYIEPAPYRSVRNVNIEQVRKSAVKMDGDENILYGIPAKEFSTAEGIDAARDFHRSLLANYKKLDYDESALNQMPYEEKADPYVSSDFVSSAVTPAEQKEALAGTSYRSSYSPVILYRLKNGETVTRRYNRIPADWIGESYDKITEIQESADPKNLRGALERYLDSVDTNFFAVEWGSAAPAENPQLEKTQLDAKQAKRLALAIYDDESKLTKPEDYDGKDYCTLRPIADDSRYNELFNDNIIIKENFSKTIAALKDFGIEVNTGGEYAEGMSLQVFDAQYFIGDSDIGFISEDPELPDVFKSKHNSYGYYDSVWDSAVTHHNDVKDEILAVMEDISLTGGFHEDGLIVRFSYRDTLTGGTKYTDAYYVAPGKPSNTLLRERYGTLWSYGS